MLKLVLRAGSMGSSAVWPSQAWKQAQLHGDLGLSLRDCLGLPGPLSPSATKLGLKLLTLML